MSTTLELTQTNTVVEITDSGALEILVTSPTISGYSVSNYTTLRTLDGDSYSIENLVDMLCTLINDLSS